MIEIYYRPSPALQRKLLGPGEAEAVQTEGTPAGSVVEIYYRPTPALQQRLLSKAKRAQEAAALRDFRFITANGEAVLMKYTGQAEHLTLPDSFEGNPVTSIAPAAFSGCGGLRRLTLSAAVTNIAPIAFAGCKNLTLCAPEGSAAQQFAEQKKLRFVVLTPPAEEAPDSVQRASAAPASEGSNSTPPPEAESLTWTCPNCGRILMKDVTLCRCGQRRPAPSKPGTPVLSAETLAAYTPEDDFRAEDLADGTISIRRYLKNDSSVRIPPLIRGKMVTAIEQFAFDGCAGIQTLTMPESITVIKSFAFSGCAGLTSVTLPKSVNSIGFSAFADCTRLTLTVPPDSYALSFAKEKQIPYQTTSAAPSETDASPDASAAAVPCTPPDTFKTAVLPDGSVEISRFYKSKVKGKHVTVRIPPVIDEKPVSSIGVNAFKDCPNVAAVIIPEGVTTIGYSAFYGCIGLTSVTLPESVTNVGDWAFYGCLTLHSLRIPPSVTMMEPHVFISCSSLTLTVPAGSYAETYAKENHIPYLTETPHPADGQKTEAAPQDRHSDTWTCPKCGKILPKYIGTCGCGTPQPVAVSGRKSAPTAGKKTGSVSSHAASPAPTSSPEDFEVEIRSDGTASIANYTGSSAAVVIPDVIKGKKVSSIGHDAFADCSGLTAVTIPESVRTIGSCAFKNCAELTSLTIPESVKLIGFGAFSGCDHLKLTVSAGSSAEIYAKSRKISYQTHSASPAAAAARPAAPAAPVSYTPAEAFETNILSDGTRSITRYTGKEASVRIPPTIRGNRVTVIGEKAFEACSSITELILPEGITTIETRAFFDCTHLRSFTVPKSVTTLGEGVFNGCLELTSLRVAPGHPIYDAPAGVLMNKQHTTLIRYPAGKKETLYQVPAGVTSIEKHAFCECAHLQTVSIPDTVSKIGVRAFIFCPKLTAIQVDPSSRYFISENGILMTRQRTRLICYPAGLQDTAYRLPAAVTVLEEGAFHSNSHLTSLTIPETVTGIGKWAFTECPGLKLTVTAGSAAESYAKEYNIPYQIQSAPAPSRTSSLPGFLSRLSSSRPSAVPKAAKTSAPAADPASPSSGRAAAVSGKYTSAEHFETVLRANGTISISRYTGSETDVKIPPVINGKKVTVISYSAFASRTGLVSVTVPEGVKEIGWNAFRHCTSLRDITLPDSISVIGHSAFWGCSSLSTVGIPAGVTVLEDYCFQGCSQLVTLVLGAGVKKIKEHAFDGCSALSLLRVASGNLQYTSVDGVLYNKQRTELVRCPVWRFPEGVFDIPDGVKTIAPKAFENCTGLYALKIPSTVTSIADDAFENCPNLTLQTPSRLFGSGYVKAYAEKHGMRFEKVR